MSTRSELETFLGAIRFFTRLPVPGTLGQDSVALERAIRYFPAVGLIIGALAGLAFAVTTFFWPKTLAVLTAMGTAIMVTGALHEDGWSDMVDGFGGGWEKSRILAIMKDSRIGSFGALALVVLLLARFCALIELDAALIPAALVAGHTLSRYAATSLLYGLDYVRDEGKSTPLSRRLGRGELLFGALTAGLPLLLLPPRAALLGSLFAGLATLWLARLCKRRLGGYTGDCLGATQQAAELAFYLGLLVRVG